MGKTLRVLFNLLPGEGNKAVLFGLLGFLWAFGANGCLTLSEGLFLEKIGASNLPKVYFFLAIAMCLFAGGLIYLLRHISVNRLFVSVLSLTIASYLVLTLWLGNGNVFNWYLFRMMGTILPISIYVCYWAFIDQFYDLQDAKRLFCLFNAITFLGDGLAGAVISFSIDSLGPTWLVVLFMASVSISIPLVRLIVKRVKPVLEVHDEGIDSTSETTIASFFNTLLRSRFTLYLMLFYFVMQLLAITTEYNYFEVLVLHYNEGHSLSRFFGMCTAFISLGNALFGLFLYSRLNKRFGVNNVAVIAPFYFLVLYLAWSVDTSLTIAVLGIIAREGIVYTFDDNNLNLLVSAVPSKIKNHVRISVESFLEPLGTFATSLLLLMWQMHAKILGAAMACLAMATVLLMRSVYPKALFKNLIATTIRFEKKARCFLGRYSLKQRQQIEWHLLRTLKKGEERAKLFALENLTQFGKPSLLPRLLLKADALSLKGKLKAIDILGNSPFASHEQVLARLNRWKRRHPHPNVKKAVVAFFDKHVPIFSLSSLIEALKKTTDPTERLHILNQMDKCAITHECAALSEISVYLGPREKKRLADFMASQGVAHLPYLISVVKDSKSPIETRLFAAKVAHKISPLSLKKEVKAISETLIHRAYFLFYHAKTIQKQMPTLSLSMLEEALFSQGKIMTNAALQLIAITNAIEEPEVIVRTLWCKNQKLRAQALESIEKSIDPKLFVQLAPLLEESVSDNITYLYLKKGFSPLKLSQLLDALTQTPSRALQMIAATYKAKVQFV